LSNYCATVANGGTRYQLHLVQSLIDNSSGTVTETQPKIEESLDLHKSTLTAVKSGMRLVATQGAPSLIFNQLRTEVAAKTGTSQVFVNGVKKNNGFLITFAPYDNPEISVASVVELAGSGTSTAEITSSIIKYWYQNNTDEKTNQKTGALLN
jgi:penicillin-binding protein 2